MKQKNETMLSDAIRIVNEFKAIESGKNYSGMMVEHSKNKQCFLGGSMMLLLLGIDLNGKNGRTNDYCPDIDIVCPCDLNDICIPQSAIFINDDGDIKNSFFFNYTLEKKDANGYDLSRTYHINLLRNTVHQKTMIFQKDNKFGPVIIGSLNTLVETKLKYVFDACAEWDGHGNSLHSNNLVYYIKNLKERFDGKMMQEYGGSGNKKGMNILKHFKDITLILNNMESDNMTTEKPEGNGYNSTLNACADLTQMTRLQMKIFRLINEVIN